MVDTRIKDLPIDPSPNKNLLMPTDLSLTQASTIENIVLSGRPSASQAEAEAGTDAVKAMTPLTSQQHLAANLPTTGFSVSTRPGSSTLSDRFSSYIDMLNDYKITTDNSDASGNSSKINAAIAKASEATYPVEIRFPPGLIACIPANLSVISKNIAITGAGPRRTSINPVGAGNLLKFRGSSAIGRLGSPSIVNIGFNCAGQSSGGTVDGQPTGFAIELDFCQEAKIKNVLLAEPYSGIYIRQSGNTVTDDVFMDNARGDYGLHAYASGANRNAVDDTVQVIDIGRLQIEGVYTAGGSTGKTTTAIHIDGFVNTFTYNEIRLLGLGRGVKIENTPGVASNLSPLVIAGSRLECEDTFLEALYLDSASFFKADYIALASSFSENLVVLNANSHDVTFGGGYLSNAAKSGMVINGSKRVKINDVVAYDNSQLLTGGYSAILVNSGDLITVSGGLLGKNTSIPSYTEKQAYGLQVVDGGPSHVRLLGVDLRGNSTGTTAGTPSGGAIVVDANCVLS